MDLIRETRTQGKLPGGENRFANRTKKLPGLLSKRGRLFLFFNLFYGAVFATHFIQLFHFSRHQKHYPHFGLILLVTLYLLYTRRQVLWTRVESWTRGGIPLVVTGVLGYILGLIQQSHLSQNDFLALTTLGIVLIWIGGFITCFGIPGIWAALFPLCFLFFVIPLPEQLLNYVITALQYASADVTAFLFGLTALPVSREGLVFTLPGLQIEVARECSSIRSSMALLITCVLASHLCLRCWWSRAVVLLLVYPLAVFKNGVRIVTLSLLTIYVDEGFMSGELHTRGGAVFFALSLTILLLILWGLRKLEASALAHDNTTGRTRGNNESIYNKENCP